MQEASPVHRHEFSSLGLDEIHLAGLLELSSIKFMALVATQDTEILLLNLRLPFGLVSAFPPDIYGTQMGRFFVFSFSAAIP